MRKQTALFLLITVFTFQGAAQTQLASTVSSECPSDHERVISMFNPNETFSNAAARGLYDRNLCLKGPGDILYNSCSEPDFYLSGNTTNSHFSTNNVYGMGVCISEFRNRVGDSCFDNETAIMSVSSKHNAHVGWPGFFDKQLCGWLEPEKPDNTTVKINLDSGGTVFIDDVNTYGPVKVAEYPYIVQEDEPHLRGIVSHSMIEAEAGSNKRRLEMTTSVENGRYFIPFTEGDHENVENRQEEVLDRTFLSLVNPQFGEGSEETPLVKTIIIGEDVNFTSSIDVGPGTYTMELVKTGENEIEIRQK